MSEHGSPKLFAPGETIIHQGAWTQRFCVVVHGYVKRESSTADGHRQLLDILAPGEPVEASVLLAKPAQARATAATHTQCLFVGRDRINALSEANHDLSLALLWAMSETVRRADSFRSWFSEGDVTTKLAHLLIHLHERAAPRDGLLPYPLTQSDLASFIGSRERRVHAGLRTLVERGVIALGYRRIRILSLQALRRQAGYDPI
ncbi:hypothetical protein BV882_07765 [Streptomyces sp. 46]|nr:hypothetical protein BV882_07765 [Streptomyces sp. 46]